MTEQFSCDRCRRCKGYRVQVSYAEYEEKHYGITTARQRVTSWECRDCGETGTVGFKVRWDRIIGSVAVGIAAGLLTWWGLMIAIEDQGEAPQGTPAAWMEVER